jgi:RHS repeat-associated protein
MARGSGGLYEQQLNPRQLVSYIGGNWGTSLSYSHDALGRVTRIDSPNNAYDRAFTYDGAGRLKTATGPWGSGGFSYDRLGNITQQVLGTRIVDVQYTASNRVSSVRDTATSSNWRSYGHDGRGNVTADGIHTFAYDFANQPISVAGADAGSFGYDGNLRRVKQVIDGKTIYTIYDRSGSMLTRHEITAGKMIDHLSLGGQTFVRVTNGVPSYPLNDHLGSAFMVASQSGAVLASDTFNFTPFGQGIGNDPGSTNRQGYTGHIEDETGLTYMQARYYDPVIGRFLSPDPTGYADGLNVYAYVGNDPVNRTDPTGNLAFLIPLGVACVETGVCQAAAIWAVRVVGVVAVGAILNEAADNSGDAPAQTPTNEGKKDPPNPNGSKGSKEHQDKIKDRARELSDEGHTLEAGGGEKPEETVRTPGGNKESRRPDITTTDPNGNPYRENVGRRNQDGTPVSRERKAQEDIKNATGQCGFSSYTPCK